MSPRLLLEQNTGFPASHCLWTVTSLVVHGLGWSRGNRPGSPVVSSCLELAPQGRPRITVTLDRFFILRNKETLFTANLIFETKVTAGETLFLQ